MAALAVRDRTLGDLLGNAAGGYARLGITDLTLDSRAVRPGAGSVYLVREEDVREFLRTSRRPPLQSLEEGAA